MMNNNDSKDFFDKKNWPWTFTSEEVNQDESAILPKITIVTPSYNQADFLEETILSIINQKYPNLEYIIIDGGSTDNSVEIIKKYEKYIDYWVSEKDFGQSHAINKGFAKATGVILNWINSDDILLPNALLSIGKSYNTRENDNVVIIGNGYDMNVKSEIFDKRLVYNDSNLKFPKVSGNPTQQSVFFSKKLLFESGGINPIIRYPMDIEMCYKFGHLNPEYKVVKDYLSCFRVHENSKTSSQDYKMLLEKINLINYFKFYETDKLYYKNLLSFYITSANFKKLKIKDRLFLIFEFIKNTPLNKRNKYKYRLIFTNFFKF